MDKKRLVDGTTALAEKRPRVIKIEPAERPQNVRLRVAAYVNELTFTQCKRIVMQISSTITARIRYTISLFMLKHPSVAQKIRITLQYDYIMQSTNFSIPVSIQMCNFSMNAVLFRRFACLPAAFLTVWGGQTKGETPLQRDVEDAVPYK